MRFAKRFGPVSDSLGLSLLFVVFIPEIHPYTSAFVFCFVFFFSHFIFLELHLIPSLLVICLFVVEQSACFF